MASGEEASVESFDAFISYNHHDEPMASAIERAIERFATPFYKRRRISVFRDSTSMTVDPDLWQAITHPMDNARFVLLLSSTHSATSKWVNREIGYCIDKKGIDQLIPVVLEGTWQWDAQLGRFSADPVAAVPPILQEAYATEPLYADLRGVSPSPKALRRDPRFTNEVAKLVSRIRDVPMDELIGDELRQRRRTVRLAIAGAAIVTALAVLATVFAVRATQARNLAQVNEAKAVRAQAEAEQEARQNLALALATSASSQGPLDRELALALAAQAHATVASPATTAALYDSLAREPRVTGRFDPGLADGDGEVHGYVLSPNGQMAAVTRFVNGGQGDQVTFIDVAHGLRVLGSVFAGGSPTVAFTDDGSRAVVGGTGPCCLVEQQPDGSILSSTDVFVKRVELTGAPDATGTLPATTPVRFPFSGQQAVSGDGRLLVQAGHDGSIHVLDLDSAESRAVAVGAGQPVTSVAISADGTKVAATTGAEVSVFALPAFGIVSRFAVGDPPETVTSLAFSPDGERLAAVTELGEGSGFHTIHVVDTATGAERVSSAAYPVDESAGRDPVRFSSDGTMVAASGTDTVVLWDTTEQRDIEVSGAFGGFDQSGARIVTTGPSGSTMVWSTDTGRAVGTPYDVAAGEAGASADGSTTAATFVAQADGGDEQIVTVGSRLTTWSGGAGPPLLGGLIQSDPLELAGVGAGGQLIGAPLNDGGAGQVDAASGKLVPLAVAESTPTAAPSGSDLIVLENDGTSDTTTAVTIDPGRAAVVARTNLPREADSSLRLLAVSADHTLTATLEQSRGSVELGSEQLTKRLVVHDITTEPATVVPVSPLPRGSDAVAAFSADSRTLFVADGRLVKAVDVRGDVGHTVVLFSQTAGVTALAVAPDGSLAYGTALGDVRVISADDLDQLLQNATSTAPDPDRVLGAAQPGHDSSVTTISFGADGSKLVTQDAAGVTHVVDLVTATRLVELHGATPGLRPVLTDHDLYVQGPQGIQHWDLTVATLEDRACTGAGRALTPLEQSQYLGNSTTAALRCT